jgi:hypothetical protein
MLKTNTILTFMIIKLYHFLKLLVLHIIYVVFNASNDKNRSWFKLNSIILQYNKYQINCPDLFLVQLLEH